MSNFEYARGLERRLSRSPSHWQARLIYADLLTELGDFELAAAQRWMGTNKKRPKQIRMVASSSTSDRARGQLQWIFGREDNNIDRHSVDLGKGWRRRYGLCLLPRPLWSAIRRVKKYPDNPFWLYFDKHQEAERALGKVLFRLEALESPPEVR